MVVCHLDTFIHVCLWNLHLTDHSTFTKQHLYGSKLVSLQTQNEIYKGLKLK